MKYRTKLYLTFSLLILGSILLVTAFNYYETRARFIGLLKSNVISIASTAATLLDVNDIKSVEASKNDQSPEFQTIVKQMRDVRDANRGEKIYVQYIYLIHPDPSNPKNLTVVADSTEGADYAPPGTPYPEGKKIGILQHLSRAYAPKEFVSDRWGEFLPGYVPIFDSSGNYVATIGVNLSSAFVDADLSRIKWITLSGMAIALAAGLIIATFLAKRNTRSLNRICTGLSRIGSGELQTRIEISTDDEFAKLAHEINRMTIGLQERDQLKLNFVRYVSQHILEKIIHEGKPLVLEGEKRKITVLFADIRHFSKLAESLPPEKVVAHLNEFLSIMIDVIFDKNGTLDKFIGDGLMIEFGAPLDDPNQEKHAIETAIAMQRALAKLNLDFEKRSQPRMEMVIGIHTGPAILGNIGSEKRMEYTAIGDTVNTASRIENAAKKLETPILVSETTWNPISDQFKGKDLGPLQLKGKTDPIKVFSIEFNINPDV